MRYTANDHIKNIEDVKAFASYLIKDMGVNINPDNDFSDYICYATGKQTFTNVEIAICNRLMRECFEACKKESVDLYDLMLSILNE